MPRVPQQRLLRSPEEGHAGRASARRNPHNSRSLLATYLHLLQEGDRLLATGRLSEQQRGIAGDFSSWRTNNGRRAEDDTIIELLQAELEDWNQTLEAIASRDAPGGGGGGKTGPPPRATIEAVQNLDKARVFPLDRERLKKRDFDNDSDDGDDECCICAVCCESLVDSGSGKSVLLTRLPCGHVYHHTCISSWLDRTRTCPECRYELLPPQATTTTATAANNSSRDQRYQSAMMLNTRCKCPGHDDTTGRCLFSSHRHTPQQQLLLSRQRCGSPAVAAAGVHKMDSSGTRPSTGVDDLHKQPQQHCQDVIVHA